MTISEAKAKLVATATAELGYREGENNYNKYADGMDSLYGWHIQNQPYCDIFVDWCFVHSFGLEMAGKLTYQPVGNFSALCSKSADYYKAQRAWYGTPEVGDQVFFYSNGGINHTGIVVAVSGGVVQTVEGNSSDMVRRNAYAVGSAIIAGYGRPRWDIFEQDGGTQAVVVPNTPKADANKCTITITLPVIRYGDKTRMVKVMQTLLIAKGYSCGWYGADGDYGRKTLDALTAFQMASGLADNGVCDGICGKDTWTALLGGW